MKALTLAVAVSLLSLAAAAQDPVKVDPGHYKVLLENATVRVLKVSVAPAGKTPAHAHPDSLLVPLADGKALFTLPDGKTQDVVLTKEAAVYTPAGTHAGTNVGTGAIDAILVEFKTPAPGKATLPTSRPGMQQTVLAESPRAVAFKSTTAPDFQEPAGTTHDYDQVVIALGPGEINLAVDGQAPVTKWQRGDVHFVGRGVKHSSKNTGGKPADVIIVAIR
jgi:quercetin dioxygenase-like cupin family protein